MMTIMIMIMMCYNENDNKTFFPRIMIMIMKITYFLLHNGNDNEPNVMTPTLVCSPLNCGVRDYQDRSTV